jgi:hypothetical protein
VATFGAMQPLASALPGLATVALALSATVAVFAARVALLGRDSGAPPRFFGAWWHWLRGIPARARPHPARGDVVALDAVRRARAARCAPRGS